MSSKAAAGRGCARTLHTIYTFLLQQPHSTRSEIICSIPGISKRAAYDKVRYLEAHGLLKFGTESSITTKGNVVLTEDAIWNSTIPQPSKWDKKWHIVTFDIPKDTRKRRDIFRRRLKELGFVLYQNSIWILPYPCEEHIHAIASFYKIEKYVCFITAEKVSNEITLKKHFNL